MRRITAAEVSRAFAKTGLNPVVGEWGDDGVHACALTALVCARGGWWPKVLRYVPAGLVAAFMCWRLGLEVRYAQGFVHAWDGHPCHRPSDSRYRLGHLDGLAARTEVTHRWRTGWMRLVA